MLAVGTQDGFVRMIEAASGEVRLEVQAHSRAVSCVALSPNGHLLASSSDEASAKVWHAATGEELLCLRGHSGADGCVCTIDSLGRCKKVSPLCLAPGHSAGLVSVAFAPCGERVATGSSDCIAIIWSAVTGVVLHKLGGGHARGLTSLGFSPDGRRLASGGSDGRVVVWCADSGTALRTISTRGLVFSVAWAPHGLSLASGGFDHKVCVWDVTQGAVGDTPSLILEGHTNLVLAVDFAPDGGAIVSSSYDRALRVWDAATGQMRKCLRGHDGRDACLCGTPGSEPPPGQQAHFPGAPHAGCTVEGHRGAVSCVAFSPDGALLASGSWERTVKLWDAPSGVLIHSVALGSKVTSVAFGQEWLREEKRIAFASLLHPRLGCEALAHVLGPEMVHTILAAVWPSVPIP